MPSQRCSSFLHMVLCHDLRMYAAAIFLQTWYLECMSSVRLIGKITGSKSCSLRHCFHQNTHIVLVSLADQLFATLIGPSIHCTLCRYTCAVITTQCNIHNFLIVNPKRCKQQLCHAFDGVAHKFCLLFLRIPSCALPCSVKTGILHAAGALAGNPFGVDRQFIAQELGFFGGVCPNSMDAVSDRDFVIETLFFCSLHLVHLSRWAEDLIIYSSGAFKYVQCSDAYATGNRPKEHMCCCIWVPAHSGNKNVDTLFGSCSGAASAHSWLALILP